MHIGKIHNYRARLWRILDICVTSWTVIHPRVYKDTQRYFDFHIERACMHTTSYTCITQQTHTHTFEIIIMLNYIYIQYLSDSLTSRTESRKPFANGLLSIFSFVICTQRSSDAYTRAQNKSLIHDLYKTRCSAIAERPHCRVRYSFRQK